MNYIDTKYISLISHRLRNYTKKGDFLWNFSCPFCGDSQKNRKFIRGFIYRVKNDLFYKCHNCSHGTTVSKLVEYVDPNLHQEYVMERYKEGSNGTPYKGAYKTPEPDFEFKKPVFKTFDGLKKFSEMDEEHPAVKFLLKRMLPRVSWNDIYFCPKFFEFTNRYVPNKFPSLMGDHPRMVIPFRTKDGNIFAFQGERLAKNHKSTLPLSWIKNIQRFLVMTGWTLLALFMSWKHSIDSLFVENCVAVAQSDLRLPQYKDKAVLVPDNEPRNRQVCKQIEQCIQDGYSVVLWPHGTEEKDINDMILLERLLARFVILYIVTPTRDYKAQTVFNSWKRI